MCDIPVPMADDEKVVRALRQCHIRSGKLRENVFRPPPQKDRVSVMRHTHMGSDACKVKAQQIAQGDPKNPYEGLAAITVISIRMLGSEVQDSREGNFCGHADISHGIVVPAGEPPESPLSVELGKRVRAMKDQAKLFRDPAPAAEGWAGDVI
jgi:hypothetical protein